MPHFTIHKDGKRIGSILQLEAGRLSVCFNRKFPQYRDTEGTPEQVKWSLRQQIPGATYQPLSMERLDAWLAELDRVPDHTPQHEEGAMNI